MAAIKLWSPNLGSCVPANAQQITLSMRNEDLQFYGHTIYCLCLASNCNVEDLEFQSSLEENILTWSKCWVWQLFWTLNSCIQAFGSVERNKHKVFGFHMNVKDFCVSFPSIVFNKSKSKTINNILTVNWGTLSQINILATNILMFEFWVHPTYLLSFVGTKWATNRAGEKSTETRTKILKMHH